MISKKPDAFRQGVEPGGMFNTSGVRLLVLYVLYAAKTPLSMQVLTDSLAGSGLANYFEIGAAVDFLTENGSLKKIETGGADKYTVTPEGTNIVRILELDIPKSVREKSLRKALYYSTKEKHRSENEVETEKTDKGCNITLHVGKPNDRIMSVTIYDIAGSELADTINNSFMSNPEGLCNAVLESLFNTDIESEE